MNNADPSHLGAPTPAALPSTAAAIAPHGQAEPDGVATLPVPYASARRRADVVVALTWVLVGLQVVMLWPLVDSVRWWSMENPEANWEPLGGRSLRPIAAIARTVPGWAFSVLYGVTAVYWCMWVHRTYRNLPALGAAGLRWTPGWAAAYYFIPVLNLFRPFQVMRETWRASDPHHGGATDWKSLAAPPVLGWWWAMHVVTFFVSHSTVQLALRPKDPGTHAVWMSIGLGMLVFDIVLMLLEVRIVRELTDRQERRAYTLGIPVGLTTLAEWWGRRQHDTGAGAQNEL